MSWTAFVAPAAISVGGAFLSKELSGDGKAKTSQASLLAPSQRSLQDTLSNLLSNQLGRGVTPFGGQRVADVSPLQQQGFDLAGGFGTGIGTGIDAFGQTLGQFDPQRGGQFLDQAQGLLGQATQDFDPQVILDALQPGRQLAQNQFTQQTVPFLSERFGATSGASGSLNRALSEAGANLSLGLSAQAAPFLAQGQQAQLNRQLQGAALGGELAGVPGQLAQQGIGIGQGVSDLLSQLFNLGSQQRGIQQEGLTAEQQRFNEAQPFNNPFLNLLGPALGVSSENIVQLPGQGIGSAVGPALGTLGSNKGFQQGLGDLLSGLFSRDTTSGGATIVNTPDTAVNRLTI